MIDRWGSTRLHFEGWLPVLLRCHFFLFFGISEIRGLSTTHTTTTTTAIIYSFLLSSSFFFLPSLLMMIHLCLRAGAWKPMFRLCFCLLADRFSSLFFFSSLGSSPLVLLASPCIPEMN